MNPRSLFVYHKLIRARSRLQCYSTANITETVSKEIVSNTAAEPKKTMIGNWIQYWKNVYRDYKGVAVDCVSQMKTNPGKSSLKLAALGFLGYCAWVNPEEDNYFNELLVNHLRLVMVPDSIRSKSSGEYIQNLENLHSLNLLRHQSFGVFSIIYNDEYSQALEVYKKQCDYLHPSYLTFIKERIVDVGFLDHWYFLNKAMTDYDINPDEWVQKDEELKS
uniref:Uncharacterized protein C19orf52 n=1 Tax=Cacopsylla melanoneura TaxID=428564 RepID=A0A8D9BVY4_9HEMI